MGHVAEVRGERRRTGLGVRSARRRPGVVRPAMGSLHEAAAVIPSTGTSTSPRTPERELYRFTPAACGNLSSGTLEAAASPRQLQWVTTVIVDADHQRRLRLSTAARGFGHAGKVWFTTKGDNRVWELDLVPAEHHPRHLRRQHCRAPVLTGVDNIAAPRHRRSVRGEDGGNMEICLIGPVGGVVRCPVPARSTARRP